MARAGRTRDEVEGAQSASFLGAHPAGLPGESMHHGAGTEGRMQGKIALEEHFAIPATLSDSQVFGAHVWEELGPRLLDFQDKRVRLMDASGVEIMILSLNAPAVQAIPDVKRAVAVAREAN